jgi:hypothetical protein
MFAHSIVCFDDIRMHMVAFGESANKGLISWAMGGHCTKEDVMQSNGRGLQIPQRLETTKVGHQLLCSCWFIGQISFNGMSF